MYFYRPLHSKAPQTPAGNVNGKVVYWKGRDDKVTVAQTLFLKIWLTV
jgi:hypothetical protein